MVMVIMVVIVMVVMVILMAMMMNRFLTWPSLSLGDCTSYGVTTV
jgi:hypothetical protein